MFFCFSQQSPGFSVHGLIRWHICKIKKDARGLREPRSIQWVPTKCHDFGKILGVKQRMRGCTLTAHSVGAGTGRIMGTAGIEFVPCNASFGFGSPVGQSARSPVCTWGVGGVRSPLSQGPTAYKHSFLAVKHQPDPRRIGIQRHKCCASGRYGHPSGPLLTKERNEQIE